MNIEDFPYLCPNIAALELMGTDYIVSNTILVGNNMDLPEKDKLSEMIIGNLGGFEKMLFDGLNDRFSLGLLLQEPKARLNQIMEGIN